MDPFLRARPEVLELALSPESRHRRAVGKEGKALGGKEETVICLVYSPFHQCHAIGAM
jgi:hypothetical protein